MPHHGGAVQSSAARNGIRLAVKRVRSYAAVQGLWELGKEGVVRAVEFTRTTTL